jgi:hypothetical protein
VLYDGCVDLTDLRRQIIWQQRGGLSQSLPQTRHHTRVDPTNAAPATIMVAQQILTHLASSR